MSSQKSIFLNKPLPILAKTIYHGITLILDIVLGVFLNMSHLIHRAVLPERKQVQRK